MSLKTAVSSLIAFVGVMGVFESCAESAVLSGGEASFLVDGTVHTFRSSGTLSVTEAGDVEVLLVGGGGAGGKGKAGGGGAGGVLHKKNFYLEKGDYEIVVGAGGFPELVGYTYDDEPGIVYTNTPRVDVGSAVCSEIKIPAVVAEDTVAFGLTAHGGGAGGNIRENGKDGASGGGAGAFNQSEVHYGGKALYLDTDEKGNKGGDCVKCQSTSGGGGGAGAPGEDATSEKSGNGGIGYECSISGVARYYAGGGGGGSASALVTSFGLGGLGGGGAGGFYNGSYGVNKPTNGGDGEPNTGGGGGGGGQKGNDHGYGGRGGSGIVIVRTNHKGYKSFFDNAVGGTVTKSGGWRIHTFTENGTFSIPVIGKVDVLLVGGGGGGGALEGGGGGGGGVVIVTNFIASAGDWPIVIGEGGSSSSTTSDNATNGGDTTALGLTALGGGAGGIYRRRGMDGASGGGGGGFGMPEEYAGGKALVMEDGSCQGYAGGKSTWGYSGGHAWGAGGGGGGAGGVGYDAVRSIVEKEDGSVVTNLVLGGEGGIGRVCDFSGANVYYGGGGGGGSRIKHEIAKGGLGGGGDSGCFRKAGSDGAPNTGGGGGGSGGEAWNVLSSGRGGSGIVIIRYRTGPDGTQILLR